MLRLDFSPQPEELPELAELWTDAFISAIGRVDESLDTKRINEAFKKARNTLKKWPAPAIVIELMPRRPEAKRINYDPPADAHAARKAFGICQDVIAGKITIEEANSLLEIEPDQEVPF